MDDNNRPILMNVHIGFILFSYAHICLIFVLMNSCAFSPLQESCLDPAVLHERMQQLMPQHLVKTQSAVAETREMVNKVPCVQKIGRGKRCS